MNQQLKYILSTRISGLLLFFCINLSYSQAQELNPISPYQHLTFPYRVLKGEHIWKNGRIPILQGEPLRLKDSVELKDGHLMIAHYSGKLFEFHGDTTVTLREIDQQLIGEKDALPNPYLTFLLSNEPIPSAPSPFICVIYPYPYEVIYPPTTIDINPNEPACIWLEKEISEFDVSSYRFEIKNIFNDSLGVFHSDSLQFELELPQDSTGLLIIEIIEAGETSGRSLGLKVDPERKRTIPTPCSASTPVELLQVAVGLEFDKRKQHALNYYEKAKKASTWEFYDHLYEMAKLRLKPKLP